MVSGGLGDGGNSPHPTPRRPGPSADPANVGANPVLCYHRRFSAEKDPSVSELVFDEISTITVPGAPGPTTGVSFSSIVTGSSGFPGETTAHLKGISPSGQNILHFDSNVDWRNFGNDSKAAAIFPLPAGSAGLGWWWLQNP